MFEEPNFFWKNFRLGTELQSSGTFIYNALYFLDKIEYLRFEEDIFEFLYNTSQGIERIQKIAIILLDHNDDTNQEEFEKDLITHNHINLHERIVAKKELNLSRLHKRFLDLLSKFYNSYRYNRFNKSSIYHKNFDKYEFLNFVSSELKIEIDPRYNCLENTIQVKKFLGKCVSKIVCELYELIRNRAYEIGTFTYEIRYQSKAFKIFTKKQYTFESENNFKKEIIVSLINNSLKDDFTDYIKTLKSLNFENHNSSYYIKYLLNDIEDISVLSEYEYLLYDKQVPKTRNQEIEGIGEAQYLNNDWDGRDEEE